MTSEHSVVNAKANVLLYDNNTGAWVASGSGQGLSKVSLYFNPSNNTYRIVGWRLQDRSVVINCSVPRTLKYHQARPTFHQWRDVKHQVYGLNFTSVEEADSFATAIQSAIDNLTDIYKNLQNEKNTVNQNYPRSQEIIEIKDNFNNLSVNNNSVPQNEEIPNQNTNINKPPAPPPVPPPPPPPGNSTYIAKNVQSEDSNQTNYDESPLAAQLKAYKQQNLRSSSVNSSNYGNQAEINDSNVEKTSSKASGGDMMSDLQRVLAARRRAKETDDDIKNNSSELKSSINNQSVIQQPPPISNNFATLRKNSSIASMITSGGLRQVNGEEENGVDDSKRFLTKADLQNFKEEIMSEFQKAINQMTADLIDAMRGSSVQ